jgi:DNA helicase-2/ATP-dependent DNA helicase PcrA
MSWLESLRQFLDEITLMTDLEPDEKGELDAVKLMTIHASKWLEFDTVYLAWAEENIFPMNRAKTDPDEMEEERRLMYVAVTRAKNNLFISSASSRMQWWQTMYNSPTRFINEIPAEITQEYNLSWYQAKKHTIFDVNDAVIHKLFGIGIIIEIWKDIAVVKFENSKFWHRKIPISMLELYL